MSSSQRAIRAEVREIAWLLARLADGCVGMSAAEFTGIWRGLEPRVLTYLRACEADEGNASGCVERLRNLTWEVAVTAELQSLHRAALVRLAQLFGERVSRPLASGAAAEAGLAAAPLSSFGVG